MMMADKADQILTAHHRDEATRSWKSLRWRVTWSSPCIRPSSPTSGVNWENTDSPSTRRKAPPSSPLVITFSALALLVITSGELGGAFRRVDGRSEEHTSELQSRPHLVCRLLLEKKKQDGI